MVENNAFRQSFLARPFLGMGGDYMHDFGGYIMFERQSDSAEGVPDMFAVIGFDRLAIDNLELTELANIGQKRSGNEVVAVDRSAVFAVNIDQDVIAGNTHPADGANMVDKGDFDILGQ